MTIKQNQIQCPDCDAAMELDKDLEKGEVVKCKECSVGLEVISVQPIKVEHLPQMEDDWGQ